MAERRGRWRLLFGAILGKSIDEGRRQWRVPLRQACAKFLRLAGRSPAAGVVEAVGGEDPGVVYG